jgi:hypothetical protein
MLACRKVARSAASFWAFEDRWRRWPGLIVNMPYVMVGTVSPWTVGADVMRHGDGVGVVVATFRSEAESCTGIVEGAAVEGVPGMSMKRVLLQILSACP